MLVFEVLYSLLTALVLGTGCGLGVFFGAWVFFRDTEIWLTIRDAVRTKVVTERKVVRRGR